MSVVPAADGGREGTCGVVDGADEFTVVLEGVINAGDWDDDGLCHGCFGGASRRVAMLVAVLMVAAVVVAVAVAVAVAAAAAVAA